MGEIILSYGTRAKRGDNLSVMQFVDDGGASEGEGEGEDESTTVGASLDTLFLITDYRTVVGPYLAFFSSL